MPIILHCPSFADLPDLRAGGIIYLLRTLSDGGMGRYFAAKGFEVMDNVFDEAALGDYCGMSVRIMPSATRLIVAVGGYAVMEAGKLLARQGRLPLWCMPTDYDAVSALTDYSLWTVMGVPTFVPAPIDVTVILGSALTPTRDGIQQAYQHLFAYYVALHSAVWRNRMFLTEGDNARLRDVLGEVERTLLSIGEYALGAGEKIWQLLPKVIECCEDKEIQLLAYAICVYKKQNMAYNRYIFAAAYAHLTALSESIDMPDLLLPPDRVAVALLAEKLGWQVVPPDALDRQEYRRVDWVWRDYLGEWADVTATARRVAKHWRRLAGSAGYGYFEDLSQSDLVTLLPLVAEMSPTYTPFKHLYLRGGFNLFI